MLILTRKLGQRIVINHPGGPTYLTLLKSKGHKVQIGIESPLEIPVHREEVHERILAERKDDSTDFNEGVD